MSSTLESLKKTMLRLLPSTLAAVVALLAAVLLTFALITLFPQARAEATQTDDASKTGPKRASPLAVGDLAPNFTLPATKGKEITLEEYRGKKNVVLYFYPKDNTPGCTAEAESFRDSMTSIEKLGAVVLGVSVDGLGSHQSFSKKLSLGFPLLADVGGRVAQEYGVMGWIMAKRITYIIGKDGRVKYAFTDVKPSEHVREVKTALSALK